MSGEIQTSLNLFPCDTEFFHQSINGHVLKVAGTSHNSPVSKHPEFVPLIEAQPSDLKKAWKSLVLLVQVAGLFGTGCLIWFASVVPRLHYQPLGAIVMHALKYACLACVSSMAIMLGLQLAIARSARLDALRVALRTARTAVWFAPATILLLHLSPAALGAALALVVSTTRLLYCQWQEAHRAANPSISVGPAQFGLGDLLARPLLLWELGPALTVSLSVQMSVVAVLMGYLLLAAALICLSAAMLTLLSLNAGIYQAGRPDSLPRSVLGIVLTVILAAGLTVGGLSPGFGLGSGSEGNFALQSRPGLLASARALARRLSKPEDSSGPNSVLTKVYLPPEDTVEITDRNFPGVILWPEIKEKYTVLVAPLPSWTITPLTPAPKTPFTIPFSGQYWMFKAPYVRPPEGSYFKRENPRDLSFVTTDHRPMSMEARQKLDHKIDLRCCQGIQIAISNADRYPGTIALELVLIDSAGQVNLGRREVLTKPARAPWHVPSPALEILDFPIPASAGIREFDQIRVVFDRSAIRGERSARISIERFILVPRAA